MKQGMNGPNLGTFKLKIFYIMAVLSKIGATLPNSMVTLMARKTQRILPQS